MSERRDGGKRYGPDLSTEHDLVRPRKFQQRPNSWRDELDECEQFFDGGFQELQQGLRRMGASQDDGGLLDRRETAGLLARSPSIAGASDNDQEMSSTTGGHRGGSESDSEDEEKKAGGGRRQGGGGGRRSGGSDAGLETVEELKDSGDGKFRLNGRHWGLTYAQVGELDAQELMEYLHGLPDVQEVMLSIEKHKDEGTHFHVFGSFNKKRNIKNSRFWDYKKHHPNIKFLQGKKGVGAWRSYITKDGTFITTESVNASNSKNFIQRLKDHQAWVAYGKRNLQKLLGATAPVRLFGQDWVPTSERRRNFWIYGAAEVGKTEEVRGFCENWTFYNRMAAPGFYEGYEGEELIIVDDQDSCLPNKDEITQMTNGAREKGKWPVYNRTRYNPTYLKPGVSVRFFIISQEPPTHLREPWFHSRFIVLEVKGREGEWENAVWDVSETRGDLM